MKNLIKLIITIIILYIILRVINTDKLLSILYDIKIPFLLLAILFQFLSNLVASFRWNLIMTSLDFKEKLVVYIKSYFKGTFFNQALPSSIGGDAIRVLELGAKGYSKREAFYGIFIDRIIGLLGLLLLNLIANFMNSNLLPSWLFNLINLIGIGSILGLIMLVLIRKIKQFEDLPILGLVYNLSRRFRKVYNNLTNIIIQTSLSIVIHLLSIIAIYAISIALGMDYSLWVFLVIFPPVILFTLIPISLAGWGVREGAMIGLFMLIGAPKEAVLSLSVLYGIIVIICSLPGMYFWLTSKNKI